MTEYLGQSQNYKKKTKTKTKTKTFFTIMAQDARSILRHLSIIYYLLTINCEALTLHHRLRCYLHRQGFRFRYRFRWNQFLYRRQFLGQKE